MQPRRPDGRGLRARRRRGSTAAALLENPSANADANANTSASGRNSNNNNNNNRRESTFGKDAAHLFERMQSRSVELRKAEERAEAREEYIKSRYAAYDSPSFAGTAGGLPFDKDEVLAELVAANKSNFLKLDQELSEDHRIATRRLHAAVFAHASDFLQLFRDVNRASALVELLKGRVQGTKAAISAISKFSTYNNGSGSSNNFDGDHRTVETAFGVSLLSGSNHKSNTSRNSSSNSNSSGIGIGNTMTGFGGKARSRPSLIATRLARRRDSTDAFSAQFSPVTGGGVGNSNNTNSNSVRGGGGGTNNDNNSGGSNNNTTRHFLSTTRALNTPSTRLWRDATLTGATATAAAGGTTAMLRYHKQGKLEDSNSGTSGGLTSTDITLFADVVREEILQLIAERRYTEAAELMRGVEAEANAKGCMPLLLALEEVFVRDVTERLHDVPMPLMYSESIHIPLVQLLLRFGRLRSGSQTFFHLHAEWLDGEMFKLQLRIDPQNGALIASDFLVSAMQEVLERQQNLWCSIADDKLPITTNMSSSNSNNNNNNTNPNNNNNNNGKPIRHEKHTTQSSTALQLPPSSAAVLWVHDRIDKLAREVLGARALSYGTGAEGGDPSRFRRAVVMLADAIRTVRRMDEFGCAGCDTHLLRLLTPSLIYLQTDFSACTDDRLESTGKSMVEYLIRDVWRMYASRETAYNPHMCGEVARRNNSGCRELQQRFQGLSQTSYAILLEMLLAPASSRLFLRRSNDNTNSNNNNNTNSNNNNNNNNKNRTEKSSIGETGAYVLLPEQYTFLRYSNGCTRVHGLLLTSVVRFVAAMTGQELLPLEQVSHELKKNFTEGRDNWMECVSFLLSNAVVTESLDVTMQRLFLSFMRTTLRQRQALVTFLQSGEFIDMHHKVFPTNTKLSPLSPSTCVTRWVFGAMQLLLADVLSASVWIAFLARGRALSYMLLDATLAFQVQYLEELRCVLPQLVQGWMAAALTLSHSVEAAQDLLLGDAALLTFDGDNEMKIATTVAMAATAKAFATSGSTNTNTNTNTNTTTYSNGKNSTSGNPNSNNYKGSSSSNSTSNSTSTGANTASTVKMMTTSPVNLVEDTNGARDAAAQLIQTAAVNETRLRPFLLDLIKRRFFLYSTNKQESALLCVPLPPPPSPAWCLRGVLGNYAQFPIGGNFDREDELFLFHWCVQISLNVLAFFQEQLLVPSHVVNQRWAAEHHNNTTTSNNNTSNNNNNNSNSTTGKSPFPLHGCVSPQEESVIAALETGGGNYAGSVALLQFIIFRLLRDVLCSAETWNVVYSAPREVWRQSEGVLRQQIFFFAVFVRFWSPLFVGGIKNTNNGQPTMSNRNNNTDGVPSLVLLQWLTCAANTGESLSKETSQQERKQRRMFDVESLAFSRNVEAAAAKSTTQGIGSWRNKNNNNSNNNNNSSTSNMSINSNISDSNNDSKRQPPATVQGANNNRRTSIVMNTNPVENFNPGASNNNNNNNNSGSNSSDDPSRLLLDVIGSFFDVLQEPRGLPAINSEVTRSRVEKVMTTVDLTNFVGKTKLVDDEDDEEEEYEEEETDPNSSSSRTSRSVRSSSSSLLSEGMKREGKSETDRVTFLQVHNLLQHYLAPLL